MTAYPHVLAKIINVPLMCHPRVAVTIYNALSGRFGTAPAVLPDLDAQAIDNRVRSSRFTGDMVRNDDGKFPSVEPYKRTPDGVAVITADGELVNRGSWVGADASGLVSYEGVKFQLARAARDPKTRAILLDINSPGGEAIGAAEVASAVRAAAENKPVYAVANGMAASAAYAMASGASRIFAAPSSLAGSIGVIMLHMDYSGALEKAGMVPTLIYAGAHKTVGNPTAPLTDEDEASLQADINKFYDGFVETVAAGRGRRMSAKAARATEARTYIGADSVTAGLADAVGTFEDALGELTSKVVRASGKKIINVFGAKAMAQESKTETEAAIEQAQIEGHKVGLEQGRELGAKLAYDRIASIMEDSRVKGHETFALKLAIKSPGMSPADVCGMCEELPKAVAVTTTRASTAEQVEATGVNAIKPGAVNAQSDRSTWNRVIESTNKSAGVGRS